MNRIRSLLLLTGLLASWMAGSDAQAQCRHGSTPTPSTYSRPTTTYPSPGHYGQPRVIFVIVPGESAPKLKPAAPATKVQTKPQPTDDAPETPESTPEKKPTPAPSTKPTPAPAVNGPIVAAPVQPSQPAARTPAAAPTDDVPSNE